MVAFFLLAVLALQPLGPIAPERLVELAERVGAGEERCIELARQMGAIGQPIELPAQCDGRLGLQEIAQLVQPLALLHRPLVEEGPEAFRQPRRCRPRGMRLGAEIDQRCLQIARDHRQQRQIRRPLQERPRHLDPLQIDLVPAELQEMVGVDRILRRRREAGRIGEVVDRIPERQPDQPPGRLLR